MPLWLSLALTAGITLAVLIVYLPGGLLWLLPGAVRHRALPADENPPAEDPEPVRTTAPALERLGFERLGVRTEQPPLAKPMLSYDWVHRLERCYASEYMVDRRTRRLYFFTPYDGGAAVLTADHRRPGADLQGYYLAGGLKGATPEELWVAHQRQMAAMEETGRERIAKGTLADRMDCARAWFLGSGKREIRALHRTAAVMAVCGLAMLVGLVASVPWSHLGLLAHH
jgi:hypothetical protein